MVESRNVADARIESLSCGVSVSCRPRVRCGVGGGTAGRGEDVANGFVGTFNRGPPGVGTDFAGTLRGGRFGDADGLDGLLSSGALRGGMDFVGTFSGGGFTMPSPAQTHATHDQISSIASHIIVSVCSTTSVPPAFMPAISTFVGIALVMP
jgi:hypothetical protein